jgi:hypothetical protein
MAGGEQVPGRGHPEGPRPGFLHQDLTPVLDGRGVAHSTTRPAGWAWWPGRGSHRSGVGRSGQWGNQSDVVDEPGTTHVDRGDDQRTVADLIDRQQCGRVDDLKVVELHALSLTQRLPR